MPAYVQTSTNTNRRAESPAAQGVRIRIKAVARQARPTTSSARILSNGLPDDKTGIATLMRYPAQKQRNTLKTRRSTASSFQGLADNIGSSYSGSVGVTMQKMLWKAPLRMLNH